MDLDIRALADELCTSWINGNKTDVLDEIREFAKADLDVGLAIVVAVAAAFPTLEDARLFSQSLENRSEAK